MVEPRLALGSAARPSGRRPRSAVPLPPGAAGRGRRAARPRRHHGDPWEGDVVVLATGAAYDHLPGTEPVATRLRRVRLQMLETAPFATAVTTSLADADTLRYYPAYESAPLAAARGADPRRGRASHPAPAGPAPRRRADHRGHARLRGAVRLRAERGPHARAPGAGPADPGDRAPAGAASVGGRLRAVRDGAVCLREEIEPGVWMVTGPGGRGMTCAPAIAADTLAWRRGGAAA